MTGATLDEWLDREYRYAVAAMQRSISRTDLVKARPGFGQVIRAAPGSIVASPVLGSYDPEPDYFFHWFRDAAVVMDALRIAHEDGALGGEALAFLADFVAFSRELESLQGASLAGSPDWRARVAPDFLKYVRDNAELARIGGNVIAETRVNPDGTLDISTWARPQHDGPALRALALARWARHAPSAARAGLDGLIRSDLAFLRAHWREPSYDIWEEELGTHYYTLRVTAAAFEAAGDDAAARQVRDQLEPFWSEREGFMRSRRVESGGRSAKELDVSVILAAIHSWRPGSSPTAHSPGDPRLSSTLDRLAAHFEQAYVINRDRPRGAAPALGRYPGDVYYNGGAWYVATLGAAEFCYRAGQPDRGDAFVETARRFTPESGELSEQFDRNTGAQISARHLAWSYAAVISCRAARRDPSLR